MIVLVLLASTAYAQTDSLTRRVNAAIATYEHGQREEGYRALVDIVKIYSVRAGTLSTSELTAVATAIKELSEINAQNPQGFRDALRIYDEAIAKDPTDPRPRVQLARLFLDRYNGTEAKRTLAEALSRNPNYVPALLLEARRRDFDSERGADSVLARALQLEPENVAGRVLRARFLADVEDFAGARREIDRALKANADDADALAFSWALAVATSDSAAHVSEARRYATLYPKEAGAQLAVAELLARVRQYASAADWARAGTRTDSTNWRAHTALGLNLLRLGDVDAARKSLETAFAGDPYNVWVKNTLDLMDTFREYDVIATPRFRLVIEKPESALLSLYLRDLADSAYAKFSAKYGFHPSTPVRVEVYRSHADFSVRTVGLAGLGALGVSFGNTVAFDSPAAKDAGPFNWASTAWHELAHTFTLGASNNRVPRWLSEGLSVYEERLARRGWGQGASPAFLQAYIDGKLLPPSRLNDGFVRPRYPAQVLFSYYEASLVCELVARDWGERALVAMLQGYRDGLSTDDVFRRALRTDPAAFDRRFDAYMRERFSTTLGALRDGSFAREMATGRALLDRGSAGDAIAALEHARTLFPDYGGADGPYPLLARALAAQGDKRRAADVLSNMIALGDVPYDMHVSLADLLLHLGDTTRAADALEGAMFMNPYEIAQHERLAALFAGLGARRKAIRERQAVVALNPVDRAEAYYQLALACSQAGDTTGARRSILRSLEEAPHFERAQELLLSLHEGKKP